MSATQEHPHTQPGAPVGVTVGLGALLFLSIWLSGPVLRHAPQAVIPWPAHGIALAMVIGSAPQRRTWAGVAVYLITLVAGGLFSQNWFRSFGGAALLTSEVLCVTLLHEALSGRRHPLRGTLALWWFGVATLFGTIPFALLASVLIQTLGESLAPGLIAGRWWVAGVTSMGAIAPVALILGAPLRPDPVKTRGTVGEFVGLLVMYLLLLANAFFEVGNAGFILPPVVATVPLLLWAGLRFGVRGYGVMATVLLIASVVSTLVGLGPFQSSAPDPFFTVQGAWIFANALIGPMMMFPMSLAERAMAESEAHGASAQLSAIIESSADMFAAVDRGLVLIAANPAWIAEFRKVTGVDAAPHMRMADLMGQLPAAGVEMGQNFQRALAGERVTVAWTNPNDRDHDEYEVEFNPVRDASGAIVGASQVARNVTERRRELVALAESRRLEAVGRLAGGVAHDFNNLMTAVTGYTSLVADSLPPDDPRRQDLAEVERAASRAGELTQHLLTFARRQDVDMRPVDIGEVMRSLTRLLSPLLGSDVHLSLRIEEPLPPVRVDPIRFEQVLTNLALNARDAMPNGGDLSVTVVANPTDKGDGIRVSVRDTGRGMSPEVLSRIWEPFFTTKPVGEGSGMGLAIVHGVVHQVGGEITVESTVGKGTTFHVILPPVAAAA